MGVVLGHNLLPPGECGRPVTLPTPTIVTNNLGNLTLLQEANLRYYAQPKQVFARVQVRDVRTRRRNGRLPDLVLCLCMRLTMIW